LVTTVREIAETTAAVAAAVRAKNRATSPGMTVRKVATAWLK